VGRAVDDDEPLIKVPLVACRGTPAAQLVGIALPELLAPLAELLAPLADRFVGHDHAALGQQLLDIPIAEREAEVQADGVADDLRGEAMAAIGGGTLRLSHAVSIPHQQHSIST
jgi:hypothetical protein